MKKILIVIILFLTSISSVSATNLDLYSEYVLLYNFDTKEIVYSKNANKRTAIASLTKLFTVYFSLENITDVNDKVTLNSNVFNGLSELGASQAGFKPGESVTYLDLLYATMLPSGADATRGLAISLFGSEENFASEMTKRMKELGLKNTNFKNSSGLNAEGQYSSVEDIHKFMLIALENDLFKEMYEARTYITTNGLHLKSTYKNASDSYDLGLSNYIIGTKTGFTNQSGVCLASTAKYNGTSYMLITTGASSIGYANLRHYIDAKTVYDYYFNNYTYQIYSSDDVIAKINLINSKEKEFLLTFISDYGILQNINSEYEIKYAGETEINTLKTKVGDKLGEIQVLENGELLYSEDVYLPVGFGFSLMSLAVENIYSIIVIITIFLILCFYLKIRRKNVHRKIHKIQR